MALNAECLTGYFSSFFFGSLEIRGTLFSMLWRESRASLGKYPQRALLRRERERLVYKYFYFLGELFQFTNHF